MHKKRAIKISKGSWILCYFFVKYF